MVFDHTNANGIQVEHELFERFVGRVVVENFAELVLEKEATSFEKVHEALVAPGVCQQLAQLSIGDKVGREASAVGDKQVDAAHELDAHVRTDQHSLEDLFEWRTRAEAVHGPVDDAKRLGRVRH